MTTFRDKILKHLNWPLFVVVGLLTIVGLVQIYATQPLADRDRLVRISSGELTWDAIKQLTQVHVVKQLIYIAGGVGLMIVVSLINYERLGRYAYLIYIVGLALLVLVLFLPTIRGTHRWIRIGGFQLQASEIAKIGFVLAMAWYLRFRRNYRNFSGLIGPLLMALIPMGLVVIEPDLGSALLFLPALFAMLFMAGAKIRHLLMIILLGLASLPVVWLMMRDYQRNRILALVYQHRRDTAWLGREGYQLARSKLAIGSGELTGQGYLASPMVKKGRLPEDHTDLIFAAIASQWGYLGCLMILFLFLILFTVGLEISTLTNEPFGRLVAVGMVALIAAQMLINVGMTVGLAPITGMGLPFVSYGGSSLWTNLVGIGFILNVARRRPLKLAPKPFEFFGDE